MEAGCGFSARSPFCGLALLGDIPLHDKKRQYPLIGVRARSSSIDEDSDEEKAILPSTHRELTAILAFAKEG